MFLIQLFIHLTLMLTLTLDDFQCEFKEKYMPEL